MNKQLDLRAQPRYPVNATVRLRESGSTDTGITCSLVDASRKGVALVLDRQPEVGDSIDLEVLTDQGKSVEPPLVATVVYTISQADRSYRVGCEFSLPEEVSE